MIFVTVGSERFPFDRLIRAVDRYTAQGKLIDVYCQIGTSRYHPSACPWTNYLEFDTMLDRIRMSDQIIAHGGAGILLLCLQEGRIPILVPRRKEWGEHVDNHQVEFVARLDQEGKAVQFEDLTDLETVLSKQAVLQEAFAREIRTSDRPSRSPLHQELSALLERWDNGPAVD